VPRLRDLMTFVGRNGFEHHVAMVRGHHAGVVEEAVGRYLGWSTYRHEAVPSFSPPAPFLR
jgi:L-fucose isomerase-like protein